MIVQGIAIVGKNDEPLYLFGCKTASEESPDLPEGEDYFGFKEWNSVQGNSMSLHDQGMVHAALDCLEEMVSTVNGQMPVIKKASSARPHWVGKLLEDDDGVAVYAHVSATNIKFMCLVEEGDVTEVAVLQKLLEDVHLIYVEEVLNPFFETRGVIRSKKFDNNIRRAIPGMKGEVIEC